MTVSRVFTLIALCGVLVFLASGQTPTETQRATTNPGYLIGPNDEISVQVLELPEIPVKAYRVDSDGTINLPLAGRVRAAGLTLDQFEKQLETTFHAQVLNPHVSVTLISSKSQPVSVLGAVNAPGTQQIEGSKSLFDVIAGAGGLKPEAGDTVTITRQKGEGPINLPDAKVDPVTGVTTAEVPVRDLVDLHSPAVNIAVQPHDQVFVSTGRVFYVIGNVRKQGGFTLSAKKRVSALEALSLAEGFAPNAAAGSARILRRVNENDLERKQIPIDLKAILKGKKEDIQIFADDILYIPNSTAKVVAARSAELALGTISGLIIWRGL